MKSKILLALVFCVLAVAVFSAFVMSNRHVSVDQHKIGQVTYSNRARMIEIPGGIQFISSSAAGLGEVMGDAIDPRRDAPVPNIDIDLYLTNGTPVDTTTTGSDGKFTFSDLNYDEYHLVVDHPSYRPLDIYFEVDSDEIQQLPPVWLVPEPVILAGDIGGRVIDVLSGNYLNLVALEFRKGIDPPAADPIVFTTQTFGNIGQYRYEAMQLDAGVYTVSASKQGYRDDKFHVYVLGADEVAPQNGKLSPLITGDEMRIVLTWGLNPSDLDSHLWGADPFGPSKVHLYYSVIPPYGTNPWGAYFTLDLDDVSSYGPETTTIRQWEPETYCFHVHNYSHQSNPYSMSMSNAGTTVTVLTATETKFFYVTPSTVATAWGVFTVDGATREITTLNQYYHQSSASNVGQDCLWM